MENRNGNNVMGTAAVVFLLGAVAGGITALLLTPRTGAQIRGRLRHDMRDLRDRGSHLRRESGEKPTTTKGATSEARRAYRDKMERRGAAKRPTVVEKVAQP